MNLLQENITTLQNISELYNQHYDINKLYHFQYKTQEASDNMFGNFQLSILNKDTHHTIYNVLSYKVTENKTNLILESGIPNIGTHTIAYNTIPNNFRFDIITSPTDGKTLVIYDTSILKEKPDTNTKN